MSWNPALYMTFGAERTRPAADLAARVDVPEAREVIDLGCGPGNSTAVVRARWPAAQVVGLDSDPEMLAVAERSDPEVRWVRADAATWDPSGAFDVVFANAVLQWLPDHSSLVPRLFGAVAAGGALAFQIPSNQDSPLDRHVREVAGEPAWPDAMRALCTTRVAQGPDFYYDILCALASRVDVWVTEYCHVMNGPEDILTWIRGTGLRPFLSVLSTEADRQRFESMLLQRIVRSYPRRRDGRVMFPFRRLFVVGYRGTAAGHHTR